MCNWLIQASQLAIHTLTWPQNELKRGYHGVEEGVRHYGVLVGLYPECGPDAVLELVHRHSTG